MSEAHFLQQAKQAIQSGDRALGRRYLRQAIEQNPRSETAWLWLSAIVDEPEQQRSCLLRVLTINPSNAIAQKHLLALTKTAPAQTAVSQPIPKPPALAPVARALAAAPVAYAPPAQGTKKDNRLRNIVLGLVASLLCVCAGLFALGTLSRTPGDEKNEVIGTPAPTSAPLPTNTPAPPTNTPQPTDTPEPTNTPTPALLTARDIERKRDELTDLQWDEYTVGLIGKEIRFSGRVVEVYDDARVLVKFASAKKLMTSGTLHGLSVDRARRLNQGQIVKGVGRIREVDVFLGLDILIDVTALE